MMKACVKVRAICNKKRLRDDSIYRTKLYKGTKMIDGTLRARTNTKDQDKKRERDKIERIGEVEASTLDSRTKLSKGTNRLTVPKTKL